MSDTHFPWKRTSRQRAAELGFAGGLEPYESDAQLPGGSRYDAYSCYFQTITRMDAQIGLVLAKLRERGLYDRTMIVVVSDHGCQWWEHERMYYVSHLYDPSLLVPLILRVPGIPGGGVCHEPVLQIDIMATVMDLLGARHVNEQATGPLPSRSLLPAMLGKGRVPPEVARSYRHRDVPLLTHYDMLGLIHDFRYKLIFDRPVGTYLLFDLEEDPGEMTNLADARPYLLADMLDRMRKSFTENKALIGHID
jgi:choline-sulfatase